MKKLTRKRVTAAGIIAGAMISSSTVLTGCGLIPSLFGVKTNQQENVYGPPQEYVKEEENIIEAVYGPPEDFEYGEPVEPQFEVDENELEDVYGPPEFFG